MKPDTRTKRKRLRSRWTYRGDGGEVAMVGRWPLHRPYLRVESADGRMISLDRRDQLLHLAAAIFTALGVDAWTWEAR